MQMLLSRDKIESGRAGEIVVNDGGGALSKA